jgi:hypothetical protein
LKAIEGACVRCERLCQPSGTPACRDGRCCHADEGIVNVAPSQAVPVIQLPYRARRDKNKVCIALVWRY